MKKILPIVICALLLSACGQETVPSPSPSPEPRHFDFTVENYPRVDGSTATIPLIEATESLLLGKPRETLDVQVSKTGNAYRMLAQHEADILLVYDGGEEVRQEVNADEFFETVSIGKDALVFLVNRDNPVSDLSTEQVRKIFSGEYTSWSDVGGSDEPIRAYQRGIGSGSQALMDKLVMPGLSMADPEKIQAIGGMGELVDAVASFNGGPTGIGYNVYYYVTEMRENDYIKILSIDGVAPSYESIQSGEYPFVSDFYSVIRRNEPEDSPARALHEWMLSDEAQRLMAAEGYVALYAEREEHSGDRPSVYPPGEEPVYFPGSNPAALAAANDYGQLYFYPGHRYEVNYNEVLLYGLCNEEGLIITEPVYTLPETLCDSEGNLAYFCYRTDIPPQSETRTNGDWTYDESIYPALLFATDGSWVLELDGAMPCYGPSLVSAVRVNADWLAVKEDGKWGAVNLKGEPAIPFAYESYDEIYALPDMAESGTYITITGSRFALFTDFYGGEAWTLCDRDMKPLASLVGAPHGAETFILTSEWNEGRGNTIRSYTLDGELIAMLTPDEAEYGYTQTYRGEYVLLSTAESRLICDREFNIICGIANEPDENGEYAATGELVPGVFSRYDEAERLWRTYLLDGTRLVTCYDPGLE